MNSPAIYIVPGCFFLGQQLFSEQAVIPGKNQKMDIF
jgi:hypothetical protein